MRRSFDSEGCVFRDSCPKFDTPDCCDPCFRQKEYFYMLDNSNLPENLKVDTKLRPAREDVQIFEYLNYVKENVISFVEGGHNLIIKGSPGVGKTTWSAKILRQYLMEHSIGNGYVKRALFVNFPLYVSGLYRNINEPDEAFDEIRSDILKLDLLVLDDIGAVAITDFLYNEIYTIINTRGNEGLSTIYTTNLSAQELRGNLGDRLYSRVCNSSEEAEIKNRVDFRKSKSIFSVSKFTGGEE